MLPAAQNPLGQARPHGDLALPLAWRRRPVGVRGPCCLPRPHAATSGRRGVRPPGPGAALTLLSPVRAPGLSCPVLPPRLP